MDSKMNRGLESLQHPDKDYLGNETVPNEIIVQIGSYSDSIQNLSLLNHTCRRTHSIFKQSVNECAYKKLAQAVIDDDRAAMKKILDSNPSLVLFIPSKGIEIESQLTWQRFFLTENILTISARRRQLDVIELLLSYCDQLNPKDNAETVAAIVEALSSWTFYEMQKNEHGAKQIIIPKEYADYAQELFNVFDKNTSISDKLNENTQAALTLLFNRLLPEKALKLDDYLDPEMLLLAVYQTYRANTSSCRPHIPLSNYAWDQRGAFCVRVMGIIQSVLTPEMAKIFCEGLYNRIEAEVKEIKKEIGPLAMEHKLADGTSYYRKTRESCDGLGGSFVVGLGPSRWRAEIAGRSLALLHLAREPFGMILSHKNKRFSKLYATFERRIALTID